MHATKIPPIPWARPTLFGNEEELVLDALRSTWISGGPYVERLEREMADRNSVRNAIAVSNGTIALELALRSLKLRPGDEVIVPAFTFVAAPNMVLALGLTPVYADVDVETFLIDPKEIPRLVTPRTKAVLPVHLYGNVADMDSILEQANAQGVAVIEDSAEALFSRWRGRCAGTLGTLGTFSFHATKTITTGEGGMVVTNDDALAEYCRTLRDHGMRKGKRYWHDIVGYNFRMTNLQAALGCAQLMSLDVIISERARIASAYKERLADCEGVRFQNVVPSVDPVIWTTTVMVDDQRHVEALRQRRDFIMAEMLLDGIETRPGFFDLNQLPPYDCPALPNARRVSAGTIALPTYVGLSNDEIDRIASSFRTKLNVSR